MAPLTSVNIPLGYFKLPISKYFWIPSSYIFYQDLLLCRSWQSFGWEKIQKICQTFPLLLELELLLLFTKCL